MNKELYQVKLKDLPLFNVERRLHRYRRKLREELRDKGLPFQFHIWVSDEWFCPDGVPGFAVPFYIFNSELFQIQKFELGFAEGASEREILRLMRHELGHAIDNAYHLRRNKWRQKIFGDSSKEYPIHYFPKPYSKNYLHYLGDHYAQSHPDEDFAETFAWWLDPEKTVRMKPFPSKIQEKLECMESLMRIVRHRKRPDLKNSFRVDPLEKNKKTLEEHYLILKGESQFSVVKRLDHNLKSAFLSGPNEENSLSLARFLKNRRSEHRRWLSRTEGVYQYEAERGLTRIIERAESLGIKASLSELQSKTPTLIQRNFRYLKQKDQLNYYL